MKLFAENTMKKEKANFSGMGMNAVEGDSSEMQVEGKIPNDLMGTLYRLGPGIFERAQESKRNLLDGDGFMQSFQIGETKANYKSRFVKTKKYLEEERNGKFIYNTWTTNAKSHPLFSNPFKMMLSQAGIAPVVKGDQLYAFDDIGQPYILDPKSLQTLGESNIADYQMPNINAHTITDGQSGDWMIFGHEYGRSIKIHLSIFDRHGQKKLSTSIQTPRLTYMHDFFSTENFVIFNLCAATVAPLGFLIGARSFTQSWRWSPEKGNLLVVVDKRNPNEPVFIECEARWMWHGLNAYEENGNIIAEYCGYDDLAHFIGSDPQFEAVMKGNLGGNFAPGNLRRYTIDPKKKTVKDDLLFSGNFDFPSVNPIYKTRKSRIGYFSESDGREIVFNQISQIDLQSGKKSTYSFPKDHYNGEAIFAPIAGAQYQLSQGSEQGYLLSLVYDGIKDSSYLAILRSDRVDEGPVAKVHLPHRSPISFHGFWNQK